MVGQFGGRVALVTGGGSGIGRASALEFARQGARVVVADIDDFGGEETVDQIRQAGGQGHFARADVAQPQDVKALISTTMEIYGRLDLAHNNAGVLGAIARLHEYPEDVWERVLRINLTGVYLCLKYEITCMLQHAGGAIVNTGSVAGLGGGGTASAYTASKHGIVGLTKLAAQQYAGAGIRVNAVCPAFIQTPMMERSLLVRSGDRAQAEATLAASQPMGRIGTPEEVAAAVVWLCSESASFITGALLPIDGGIMTG